MILTQRNGREIAVADNLDDAVLWAKMTGPGIYLLRTDKVPNAVVREIVVAVDLEVNMGPTQHHMMICKTLRDLQVECSCGGWTFTAPTFDDQSDEQLRQTAKEQFAFHERRFSRVNKSRCYVVSGTVEAKHPGWTETETIPRLLVDGASSKEEAGTVLLEILNLVRRQPNAKIMLDVTPFEDGK